MEHFSIKSWAEDDRPRKKLTLKGKSALTDAELLAILISSGSKNESAVELCKRILSSVDNNLNLLGKLSVAQLSEFKGIGEAKAISIIAALELGRRRKEIETQNQIIKTSRATFDLMQPILGELPHEEFWVIYLNNSMRFLYKSMLSKGGITGTVVDFRMIFKIAFEQNATGIVLIHNHPSGNKTPSDADIEITKKIQIAASHLDIRIHDHVIVTEFDYYSFKDEEKL